MAVVGVGSLGRHHARIFAQMAEARLVAVVDTDAARAREIGAAHGVPALTDHRDLGSDLDAVSIAVPTSRHAAVTEDCLGRGLAVLVEKPMAATLAEAESMLAAAARADRPLLVGHTERFNPALRAAAARIRDPRFIEAHRLGVFAARSTDIDVVLDLMIHDLDAIFSLVPAPLESIDAVGVDALTDKIDIANARLRFANGCVANVTASRVSTDRTRKLRVFEADSYVSIDFAQREVLVYALRRGGGARPEIVREEVAVDAEEPLAIELRSFVRTVRGCEAPAVSGREGLEALRAALRIADQIGGNR